MTEGLPRCRRRPDVQAEAEADAKTETEEEAVVEAVVELDCDVAVEAEADSEASVELEGESLAMRATLHDEVLELLQACAVRAAVREARESGCASNKYSSDAAMSTDWILRTETEGARAAMKSLLVMLSR